MPTSRGTQFWLLFALFQIAFGASVFYGTQYYYLKESTETARNQQSQGRPAGNWSEQMETITPALLDTLVPLQTDAGDPANLVVQANAHFENKQYVAAAKLYEKLIDLDPRNIDAYNNLGITLHYLGRSAEALEWLDAGINLDSTHQRIWLTLGFVHKDLGNFEPAQIALSTAVRIDSDSTIGKSSARFLEEIQAMN
ncbi:MAG: tetratricopeptide repeat protein [Woeseiales bacterium]